MRDVALIIGGSEAVWDEYMKAAELCVLASKEFEIFCCNDMIAEYPREIDHAVTLHPPKFEMWRTARKRAGYPPLTRVWGHRKLMIIKGPNGSRESIAWGATDQSDDLGGSVGLLATKIAYELGYRKIILCGVPMTCEAGHFTRKTRWLAAHGFRKGWTRPQVMKWGPSLRSMSGWTAERFGMPTVEWLR